MAKSEKVIEYKYIGKLSPVITRYVNEKRGMGVIFNNDAKKLRNFDKFTLNYDFPKDTLPKELVLAYTSKTSNESDSNRYLRIGVINRFAEYMQRCGHDSYIMPVQDRRVPKSTFAPYIFSEVEIQDIFFAVDQIKPSSQNRHIQLVAQLFFRMIYSCGMRLSEMLYLTAGDVDLEKGLIRILETKFNKSRYVPMSESLWKLCTAYSESLHCSVSEESPFFPNRYNEFYTQKGIYVLFRRVLREAGISHGGKGNGPRLHDFRHTFAVHCLKKWSLSGTDLTVALPYLSTYLGHTGLHSTQKYLRLTADVFPLITQLQDVKFGDVIPDIGGCSYEH